jgi:hypothetical protein
MDISFKKIVVLGALLYTIYWWHTHNASLNPPPGVLAPRAPRQIDIENGASLQHGDFTLRPRARFELTARVLSRKNYSDQGAALAPVDLAMGWGRMSDSSVLKQINIQQYSRFYYWQVREYPIPHDEIVTSSANMHMIPANDDVLDTLKNIRQGEVVRLKGLLVDASRSNWYWNTSLTRADSGMGACELVYVIQIEPVSFK